MKRTMFKYRVYIKKVSGRLNESVLPNKNLIISSKTRKTYRRIFNEASKYFKNKYNLIIEKADIKLFEDFEGLNLNNPEDTAWYSKHGDKDVKLNYGVNCRDFDKCVNLVDAWVRGCDRNSKDLPYVIKYYPHDGGRTEEPFQCYVHASGNRHGSVNFYGGDLGDKKFSIWKDECRFTYGNYDMETGDNRAVFIYDPKEKITYIIKKHENHSTHYEYS